MATIEFYRERMEAAAAEASAATSDRSRSLARRSEGAWRRLVEISEKRDGAATPRAVAPAPKAKPAPRRKAKPKVELKTAV